MKSLRLPLLVAACLIALSCTQLFSKLDNPADEKAANYQGYPTVSDPGAVGPVVKNNSGSTLFAPKLVATKVSGAERYHFQIATADSFAQASIVHENDKVSGNEYLPLTWSGYDPTATYYWRIRVYKAGTWGPWSTEPATLSFTSPTLGTALPEDAATVSSPTPLLDWSDIEGAVGYHLQVSAASDFSSFAIDDESLTASAFTATTALLNATTYHWRVSAKGAEGTWTGFAKALSFITSFPAAEAPTFAPAAGGYSADQLVTISSTTADAVFHYTSDGSEPTVESPLYSAPIAIAGDGTSITVKAFAFSPITSLSKVSSAKYAINYPLGAKAASPTFDIPAGDYSADQAITISTTTTNATIYYTTDGTTPTAASTKYTKAVSIEGTGTKKTIKAVAVSETSSLSDVASAAYTVTYNSAAKPTFSPAAGPYSSDQSITISATTSGATIYYTTDGTTPLATSLKYTSAIGVTGHATTTTIKAMVHAPNYLDSDVTSGSWTISYPTVSAPVLSPPGATYSDDQSVGISSATQGAFIYYTMDGSMPSTSSTLYTGTISIAGHNTVKTIKAIAVASGYLSSGTTSGVYTIDYTTTATPTFSPGAGNFTVDKSVTLSCITSGASIYYTTNGGAPSTASTLYSGPISVAGHGTTMTITAAAIAAGHSLSSSASALYAINYPAAATPTFSPSAGNKTADTGVTISCATTGASIYYTTDGSTPTTDSTKYAGETISVAGNATSQTIKALATATGYLDSAVGTGSYTINYPLAGTPSFSKAAGTYTSDQSIALSTTTPSATIYYTTNNTTPTSSSTVYSTPISVAGHGTSMVIQAKAISATTSLSSAANGTFTISYPPAATPTFSPAGATYSSAQSVSISTTTGGATIYYTTDGSTPTTSSTVYSSAVSLDGIGTTKTLKAIAISATTSTSAIGSAAYTFNYPLAGTPSFSKAAGTYT
ncbi:MAG: chitobiase/beta-hexosaminidase C-terminal domain-containing protein, partial [Spirochaetota bacterium]